MDDMCPKVAMFATRRGGEEDGGLAPNRFGSDMSGRASSGRYFQMSARTSPLIHNTTTSIAALKTPGSLARSREKSFP